MNATVNKILNETKDISEEETREILANIQNIFKGGVRELNPEKRTGAMKRYFEFKINLYCHNR